MVDRAGLRAGGGEDVHTAWLVQRPDQDTVGPRRLTFSSKRMQVVTVGVAVRNQGTLE